MAVEHWLNEVWYGATPPPWWLRPLTRAYAAAAGARRLAYRAGLRHPVRLARPLIVVGNLTVGGTGKTPLVCWLAAQLRSLGCRPGVVSRGYGGRERGPLRVTAEADPARVGDEALLIARHAAVPVAIARMRPAAAQLLIEGGCDVVLSDDGLQHPALARDCEIVVLDGERGLGNGWLLPAGPLREAPRRLALVDAVVVNGENPAAFPGAHAMRLVPGAARSLGGLEERALGSFAGGKVHAIAGIGNPDRFFSMLRAHGIEVDPHPLPDHAPLRREDLEFGDRLPVLMTEKDAVKCAAMTDERHWYIPVEAHFAEADAAALLGLVRRRLARAAGAPECLRG